MPELDRLKEEVSCLKFWQGIAVWVGIIVVVLVRQTARRINEIGKL
jgi:hypothetical protein